MCTARTHTVPAVEREWTAPTHVMRWHGKESVGQLSATSDLASLAARGQAGRERIRLSECWCWRESGPAGAAEDVGMAMSQSEIGVGNRGGGLGQEEMCT
jgi:hypothetical protein